MVLMNGGRDINRSKTVRYKVRYLLIMLTTVISTVWLLTFSIFLGFSCQKKELGL